MAATIWVLYLVACGGPCVLGLVMWGVSRRSRRRRREMEDEFVEGLAVAVQTGSVETLDDLQDFYCGFFDQSRLTARDRSRLLQIVRKTSFKLASQFQGSAAGRQDWAQLLRELRVAAKGVVRHAPVAVREQLLPGAPLGSGRKLEPLDFTEEEMRVPAARRPARVAT